MTMHSEAFIFKKGCQVLVACLLSVTLSISSQVSPAQAKEVTFSWRASPAEESIFSYRLYYSPESRYEPRIFFSQKSGFNEPSSFPSPKSGFTYEYFIDLVLEQRCPADSCYDDGCEQLPPGTVSCEGLFGAVYPEYIKCTVLDLPSWSYFSLTAYDSSGEESYYSDELTNIEPEIFVGEISVSTTEFGWTALFGVALSIPPAADVTINLSSDDTSEGSIFPVSITLNADNMIQFVHVSWFGDGEGDGISEYNIITAPAESLDLNYVGIDPDDLVVVN